MNGNQGLALPAQRGPAGGWGKAWAGAAHGERGEDEEGKKGCRAGGKDLGVREELRQMVEELQAERGAEMMVLMHLGSPKWLLGLARTGCVKF